mgnify:CR=1 FL=1
MPPRKSWCHVICYKLVPLPQLSQKPTPICGESLLLFALAPYDLRPCTCHGLPCYRFRGANLTMKIAILSTRELLHYTRCLEFRERQPYALLARGASLPNVVPGELRTGRC